LAFQAATALSHLSNPSSIENSNSRSIQDQKSDQLNEVANDAFGRTMRVYSLQTINPFASILCNWRHRAAPRFAAQPAHQRRQQKIHVEAVGLGALAAPLNRDAGGVHDVDFEPALLQRGQSKIRLGRIRNRQRSAPP
jgi:hypothetical protein